MRASGEVHGVVNVLESQELVKLNFEEEEPALEEENEHELEKELEYKVQFEQEV